MKHISESIIGRRGASIQRTLIIIPINEDLFIFKRYPIDPKNNIVQTKSKNGWDIFVLSIQDATYDLIVNIRSKYTKICIAELPVKNVIDLCYKMHVDILFKSNALNSIPQEFKEITKEDCIKIIKTNK